MKTFSKSQVLLFTIFAFLFLAFTFNTKKDTIESSVPAKEEINPYQTQEQSSEPETTHNIAIDDKYSTLSIETSSISDADNSIRSYLTDIFPLISDETLDEIVEGRLIENIGIEGNKFYNISYKAPKNYFADTVKLLWELNIPEFRSNLYQIYEKDTIYLDTWKNVVGTASSKTYTGNFQAYRIRNWPSWKDPEKPESAVTPPGPKNPLGLFVVHYDENSLRYFHGTNKEYLMEKTMRNLSHGCVRNMNKNIQKMKEFIIKKVVSSEDLTYWFDSQKTLLYNLKEEEKFPVRIIYKTYRLGTDPDGDYIELYSDIYGYAKKDFSRDKFNDPELVFLSTKENIKAEYRKKIGNKLSDAELDHLINKILQTGKHYERYYFDDLIRHSEQ